jgi:hypothetical protein
MSPISNTTPIPRLAYTIDEAIAAGVGSRSTIYRLEWAGKVKLIRGCGRVKIAAADLHRLLGMGASQ